MFCLNLINYVNLPSSSSFCPPPKKNNDDNPLSLLHKLASLLKTISFAFYFCMHTLISLFPLLNT